MMEIPVKAVEAAARAEYGDWDTLGEPEREECRAALRRALTAALPALEEAWEKRLNVLTREEARLLVYANDAPYPDSEEQMQEFADLLDRLDRWSKEEPAHA